MINNNHCSNINPDLNRLSRSASQTDQSDQSSSSVYLRDQSNCSSLTSGIGQSDQSICNEQNKNCTSNQQTNTRSDQNETLKANPIPSHFHEVPLNDDYSYDNTNDQDAKSADRDSIINSCETTELDAYPGPSQLNVTSTDALEDGQQTTPAMAQEHTELEEDIKNFVDIIFTDSQSISLEKKADFGKLMRRSEARLIFAKFVDDYRVNSKRVNELTFYSLAQYFSIVLLECLLAEDFRPAKIIMNMMFTYYYEQNYDRIPIRDRPQSCELLSYGGTSNDSSSNNDQINDYSSSVISDTETTTTTASDNNYYSFNYIRRSRKLNDKLQNKQPKERELQPSRIVKTYLYSLLKEQEIFKSVRFWTSAFYESVVIERSNHPVFVAKRRSDNRDEEMDCSKNITFGLLGSFIHNMCLLGLSQEFCQEFLDKHSTIAGLSEDQLDMLRSNLKSMFSKVNNDQRVQQSSTSGASTGERLSMFLQKWSNTSNSGSTNR